MKSDEKLKIALHQSATVLFVHLDQARRKRLKGSPDADLDRGDEVTREAARRAVALWDEIGALLSTGHAQARLRS
jgi:hypothetical protein